MNLELHNSKEVHQSSGQSKVDQLLASEMEKHRKYSDHSFPRCTVTLTKGKPLDLDLGS
jgi:hypothetical protein